MRIAIASGKGGTGKTTVSTNLAWVLARAGETVRYLDCDVEEPNGHLFLQPTLTGKATVSVPVPTVDAARCTGCAACAAFCRFNSLSCVKGKVIVFPELCHGCGGCMRVCPVDAIGETPRPTGELETGTASVAVLARNAGAIEDGKADTTATDGRIDFAHGRLAVGEVMSPPLIHAVRAQAGDEAINLIDAPPGTSCPVITAVEGVDYVILVTEPTPFGLSDLALALDLLKALGLPHGVVVNRHTDDNDRARTFCAERDVPILCELPDDRRIAEAYSRGALPAAALPELVPLFESLWRAVREDAAATVSASAGGASS